MSVVIQPAQRARGNRVARRRVGFVAWAFALVFALIGVVVSPARAEFVPLPDDDPFYVPPSGYESLPNGTVLRDRTINAQYLLPFLSTDVLSQLGNSADRFFPWFEQLKNLKINAYQVLYKSLDSHDRPTAQVATVLVPQGPWIGGGPRPLIAFQVAQDSTTTRAAPSYTLRAGLLSGGALANPTFEVSLSLPALAYGYAIVYPDYEGPHAQFIAGPQAGHGVLDGVRAVLNYAPAGLAYNTPVGLWGYSGGGHATGWAAYLKESYAPELNVKGAAVGASAASDLVQMYYNNNGKFVAGSLLVTAIAGLNRAFPEAGIYEYLNPAGKLLIDSAQDETLIEGILKRPVLAPLEMFTNEPWVPVPESKVGKYVFGINTLAGKPAPRTVPILNYHDEFDELVPVKADNDLALQYCREGVPVEVMRTFTPIPLIGLVHIAGEAEGALPALNYLANRFKGLPPRNDCPYSAIWASPLPLPYKAFITQ